MAALQKYTPSTYPETAHQVWDEDEHLKQLAIQIIFHLDTKPRRNLQQRRS
jgi:hypothetical protein